MSNTADKTEYRALSIIARIIKEFEKLHYLNMTKSEYYYAHLTRRILEGVIERNGYQINYGHNSKKPLLKNHTHALPKQ